ncbi:MAG: 30S ribosomal protein S6 [Lachnospiraceae bacterium]|jgi:small subunit ribosomal protein S6|nr:30S ribosomal protein S6 [Lachnospiraceae bacterium]
MNKYESIVIIKSGLEETAIKALIQKFSDLINNDGEVVSVEEIGLKRLAYEINKQKEGYYVIFKFAAKPTLIAELERVYRIADEVLKFITIKNEE